MGLLLGGSVLTVFELIDLIVFRFVNSIFGTKQKPDDQEAGSAAGTGTAGLRVQSVRASERPVSAVSTINPPQRRIRRIAKYPQPTPTLGSTGGRPAIVVQTNSTATSGGECQSYGLSTLSQKSETVAVVSPFSATVSLFCDSGQGFM